MNQDIRQDVRELEEQGWEADATPAFEKRSAFPDYKATMNFLVAVGREAAATGAPMPSIRIENGTEVKVRVGGPPVRAITAEEIALAKALSAL